MSGSGRNRLDRGKPTIFEEVHIRSLSKINYYFCASTCY